MARCRAIAKAYFGSRVIEVGETLDWPDGDKLPTWLVKAGVDGGGEQVAVPAPGTRKAKAKPDDAPGESAGMTAIPSPVPAGGADWIKPNT